MSPQGKAAIIRAIQDHDKDAHVFMCGDGGNDVGALKQVSSSMSRVEIGIMMLLWSVWFVAVLVLFTFSGLYHDHVRLLITTLLLLLILYILLYYYLLLLQANVGLALLAGHANANTTEDIAAPAAAKDNAGLLKDAPSTGTTTTTTPPSTNYIHYYCYYSY